MKVSTTQILIDPIHKKEIHVADAEGPKPATLKNTLVEALMGGRAQLPPDVHEIRLDLAIRIHERDEVELSEYELEICAQAMAMAFNTTALVAGVLRHLRGK